MPQGASSDLPARLAEADRLAWLTNWYDALPIYIEVEQAASKAGNRRDAMYAKFGRLRGQMQVLPLPDISEQIAADLATPLAKQDRRLRLRGLTVKGDIDLEWDVLAAERDWREVRLLARELGDAGWENRANGELGMVVFLKGNTGEATKLVQQAYQTAEKTGDIGGQLRYMGTIAEGLRLAGYAPLALGYVDRALKFASEHPETGFPFVAYSSKMQTLLALKQPDEAERFAKTAMAEAKAGDRRIKEIELSMMLAQIAEQRGQPDEGSDICSRLLVPQRPAKCSGSRRGRDGTCGCVPSARRPHSGTSGTRRRLSPARRSPAAASCFPTVCADLPTSMPRKVVSPRPTASTIRPPTSSKASW